MALPSENMEAKKYLVTGGSGFFGPTPLVETTEVTGLRGVEQPEPLRAERAVGGMLDAGVRIGALELNGTIFGSRVSHPVAVVDFRSVDGGGRGRVLG